MSTEINSGNEELDAIIREYLEYAGDLNTAADVRALVSKGKYCELEKIMKTRLSFGTAGLRGVMGPGYAAMNDLVIIQTSQGLAAYLHASISEEDDKINGVVIGFDNRHNSPRFAHLAAVSFLLKGFRVYIFSSMTPTPFIPFTVKEFGCLAGIMVTASHNPKDDNGYKVYWSNGAQILPPHDQNIQESILRNLKPWPNSFDTSLVWTSPLAYDPLPDIEQLYYSDLKNSLYDVTLFRESSLKITFTAMHGVSHSYVKKVFQKLDFDNYIPVKEQMYPDPNFPTVKFPNPEEKNCLDLAIQTADKNGSRLILANDPDGDRLAVAEKLHDGRWYVYTGNEIGALLGSWMWKIAPAVWKTKPESCCMVSSTVSSKILKSIAKFEGFTFYETLTGFKWMANKADEAMKNEKKFIFAFEEAIGYMCGSTVLDKDGIQAAMQIASMAAHGHIENKLLHDLLKETYMKYGYHVSCNSYFICHDPVAIKKMFDSLRNYNGVPNKYPPSVTSGDREFLVMSVRDLTTGYSSNVDENTILPSTPDTQMITFYFDVGCEATLRTSGTEPKIKYYTELKAQPNLPECHWDAIKETLQKIVDGIVKEWIQPEKNGFSNRPS